MRHFLIIIIGHSNFLNICEDLIYLFNPNVWFSLYESHSPSYFICHNTTNPQSLATVLEIDINQIQHFTLFSSFFLSLTSDYYFEEIYNMFLEQLLNI